MAVDEKSLNDYPNPVSIENIEIIYKQMKKSVCKICLKNGEKGTGFLCQILFPEPKRLLKMFITNNHLINRDFLKKEKCIKVTFDNDKVIKTISLKNKKTYTNKEYDITIIEIKKEDEINDNAFLDADDIKIEKSFYGNIGNTIYILHYPNIGNEQKLSISLGVRKQYILDSKCDFKHYCSTEHGSSGSPILNLSNKKVIGIHKQKSINENFNIGAVLYYAIEDYKKEFTQDKEHQQYEKPRPSNPKQQYSDIKEYQNKSQFIKIKYKINESKIIKLFGDDFVKNNKNNCSLFINGEEKDLDSYLKLEKYNINNAYIEITLKGVGKITNMSYIFSGCDSLSSHSDFSNWNTCNVNNMSYMFFGCKLLEYLPDISSFNTNKVTDMSSLFSGCRSLKKIPDISSWNTSNVTNMSNMFTYCSSLECLPNNISHWNVSKVYDMTCMFYQCSLLKTLPDISIWDVNNVKNMSYMFYNCISLESLPELKNWKINKSCKIEKMFLGCNNPFLNVPSILKSIDHLDWR